VRAGLAEQVGLDQDEHRWHAGAVAVLTYKAMYKSVDGGVHAEVLDFPGVITCAPDIEMARRLLGSALVDVAETHLSAGEPLPAPDPSMSDPEADLEEPIHLLLQATSHVVTVAAGT
jgi:predicted RNase H-like HicB family nuclease